jgi:hypothetical protein
MKLTFVTLSLFLAILVSCKSKSAFDYSEKIVAIERSLGPSIMTGEKKIIDAFQTSNMDTAIAVSKRMAAIIGEKITDINALTLPDVEEGENFKKATVRHFTNLRDIYAGYGRIAMQPTDEERESERQKVLLMEEDGKKSLVEMQRAQRKFAEANGFKIK